MNIFGDFICVFAFFYSFFRKNDEKLAYVFGVRAYLIDFGSGGFYLGLAGVIPTPTSSFGVPILVGITTRFFI